MRLYLIRNNGYIGYDTYDSAVVAAVNENQARFMHPGFGLNLDGESSCWCTPEQVIVLEIGITDKYEHPSVICASFNAG